MLDFTNMFLSLFFLLISKALADEYSKGYLRREHSIFKGKMTKYLLKIFMQESSKWTFEVVEGSVRPYISFPV